MAEWQKRDLSKKRYVYFWVDGIHSHVRMNDHQCLLVVIGATADGVKELVAVQGGLRESEISWLEILNDLCRRGLIIAPELAIGDGALGFWKAVGQVFPKTKNQRCWVHKTANILNKLPKSLQKSAKVHIHEICMAPTKEEANKQFDSFIKTYQAKYPKATECLMKDRQELLAFYDFPAEHWKSIRTTNPIESTFATVRLRTAKVRYCFSSETVAAMAYKLCKQAEARWQRLAGIPQLAEIIRGVRFVDGIKLEKIAA